MEFQQDIRSVASFDTKSVSSGGQHHAYQIQNSKDNVKVMIRVRPLNEREKNNGGHKTCVTVDNETTLTIESRPDIKSFAYDFVGDDQIDQETIFNVIAKPIADSCLEGYNGSIFAYGQTGAGKTFTIQGPSLVVNGEEQIVGTRDNKDQDNQIVNKRGIMQRSFEYIYDMIDKERQQCESSSDTAHFESLVRCSYLEIYNEQILDLLDPSSHQSLHLREDIKKGVYVEGLQEEVVLTASDMIRLIQEGTKKRHTGSTSMNKESSRSHSVLTTVIETKSMKEGGVWNIKTSRFHIIDLAGSERSKHTNTVGDRLKEAGMINKSLSALGNVINSLVDISEGKSRHVHYRDSKLTFLLRDSLGGNSKTVIIANISPSSLSYGETLSTLKFAQRAKLIRNKAVINEDSSGTISLLKSEINRLKKELAESEHLTRQPLLSSQGYCSICKALIGPDSNQEDEEEDELLINNISCCEDLEQSVANLSQTHSNDLLRQKFKSQKDDLVKMRRRVVHLEGLLSANLDNLASQQKYYDNEIQKHVVQQKKMQQAVESFEKQAARDKMIIKFREDRITKLEINQPVQKDDQSKQIGDLKKEILLWKEATDHNSQAAKLFAEKAELQIKFDQLKKETQHSPDSLSSQMRSLTELTDSLSSYLKLYCEEAKKGVETEMQRTKQEQQLKMDSLIEKMSGLKQKYADRKDKYQTDKFQLEEIIQQLKGECEQIRKEFQEEREQTEKGNKEAIEQIKVEIEQISENKTEQEKEIQMFRVQLLEKEQLIERERKDKSDLEKHSHQKQSEMSNQMSHLQSQLQSSEAHSFKLKEKLKQTIDNYDHQLDTLRKDLQQQLLVKESEVQDLVDKREREIMQEMSDKEVMQEQCEQLSDKLRELQEENQTMEESMLFKEEQIRELQAMIQSKEKQIEDLKIKEQELLQQNNQCHSDIESLRSQILSLQSELSNSQSNLNLHLQEQQELQLLIKDLKEEISQYQEQKDQLQSQIDKQIQKISSQADKISELEESIEGFKKEIETLQKIVEDQQSSYDMVEKGQIEQFTQQIQEKDSLILQITQEKDNTVNQFETELQKLQIENSTLQENICNQVIEIENLNQQVVQDKNQADIEIHKYEEKIQSIQQENKQIELALIQQIEELKSEQALEVKRLVETKESEIKCIKARFQEEQVQEIKSLELQYQQVTMRYEEQKEQLEIQNQQLKEQIEVQIQKIDEIIIQTQTEKEETVEQTIMVKEQEFKQEIEQIQQQYQQEIQQVQQQKDNIRETLTLKIQEIILQKEEVQQALTQNLDLKQQEQSFIINDLHLKNQSQHEQILQIQQQATYLQQQCDQKESIVNQLESQIQSLECEIDSKNDLISSLQQDSDRIAEQYQQLKSQKTQIEEKLYSTQQFKEQLKEQVQSLQEEGYQLQNQISIQNGNLEQIQQELTDKSEQYESLSHQQIQFQNTIVILETKLSQQIQSHSQNESHYSNEVSKLQNEVRDLSKVDEMNQRQIEDLTSKLQKANFENLQLTQINEDLNQKLDEFQNEYQLLQNQFEHQQSQSQSLEEDLSQHKQLLDDTLSQLNKEHVNKYQELEQEYSAKNSAIKQENDSYQRHIKDLNVQIGKLRQTNEEQTLMLTNHRDTMQLMVKKEKDLISELEKNINLFKDKQEKHKQRIALLKQERDQARTIVERAKKESDNLKELIKLKDRQIEEQLNSDEKDKQQLQSLIDENKNLRNLVTKREFEMRELARTMKHYSDETHRLEKELEKLHRENDQLIGHKNPSQKIQHHVKIKEENNKLREENCRLQEELRKKVDFIHKTQKTQGDGMQNQQEPSADVQSQEVKKLKKEVVTYQETINRLTDHLLSQPNLMKAIGFSDENNDKLMQQNGPYKVKKAMEIVSMVNGVVQSREREHKDLEREIKKYEARIEIIEKEKNLFKQQIDLMQPGSQPSSQSFTAHSSTRPKRSPLPQDFALVNNSNDLQHQFNTKQQYSRLHVEGFMAQQSDDKQQHYFDPSHINQQQNQQYFGNISNNSVIQKQSPSPIYNVRQQQQKEKENVQSKRDLFGQQQRSGSSARRNQYMNTSGNNNGYMQKQ